MSTSVGLRLCIVCCVHCEPDGGPDSGPDSGSNEQSVNRANNYCCWCAVTESDKEQQHLHEGSDTNAASSGSCE